MLNEHAQVGDYNISHECLNLHEGFIRGKKGLLGGRTCIKGVENEVKVILLELFILSAYTLVGPYFQSFSVVGLQCQSPCQLCSFLLVYISSYISYYSSRMLKRSSLILFVHSFWI